MSHGHFLKSFKENGIVGTFKELYKMRTLKFGQLVGTDRVGNKYYENRKDYAHGQHRWVVYAGEKNFYQVDASNVPAEWHAWLHHATEEPPTSTTVGSTHRVEPIAIAHGSSAPYARNLGGVISKPTPNFTQERTRGWGLGEGDMAETKYYTQPGWPLDKRNATRFVSARKQRVKFSLKDTPLTLAAKEAAKANVSLEEYATYTDDDSPTKALLLLTEGQMSAAEAKAIAESAKDGGELLAEGAAGIPEDPAKKALALRLASGLPATASDVGTFAAAAADVLTPEEESLLASGEEEDSLSTRAGTYQRYIEEYSHIDARDAQRGVAKAVQMRDATLAKLATLRSAKAKVARLQDQYDAKAYNMAKEALME